MDRYDQVDESSYIKHNIIFELKCGGDDVLKYMYIILCIINVW